MNTAPKCFRRTRVIGKLFDQDAQRLQATAHCLGVRIVRVDRFRQNGQHVDLVEGLLRRAMEQAENV